MTLSGDAQSPAWPGRDRRLAITAESLYLLNISFLPVVAFIVLLILYSRHAKQLQPAALMHFRQSIIANIASGILLILVSLLIVLLGGLGSPYTWMFLLLYFTCVHSALILFGVFGVTCAASEREYVYPLIGRLWK